MNRIIVTPAGRKRYLEVLFNNLSSLKSEFDTWILWVNTANESDINYMVELEKNNDWVKLQKSEVGVNGNNSIAHFFKKCADPECVYIRLDDDIVYIHKHSLKDLFNYRIENPEPFLVYGNIVNNSLMSHIHQRAGYILSNPKINYSCLDKVGWDTPAVAEAIHRSFLSKLRSHCAESFYISNWILRDFERVSINVISWSGSEFNKFDGIVDPRDEEIWLSCQKSSELNKPNIIFGKSLFVHYSYFTQRTHMDSTDILSQYLDISKKLFLYHR